MATKLTLEILESYGFKQRTYKPDWDDVAIDFTLTNGLLLTCLTVCCNSVVKNVSLEGVDGYIYINTKEELDELLKLNIEEIFDNLEKEHPDFDKNQWL